MRTLIAVGHLRKLLDLARTRVDESLRHFEALTEPDGAPADPGAAMQMALAGATLQQELCEHGEEAKRIAHEGFRRWQERSAHLADLRSRNVNLRELERDRARFAVLAEALRRAWYIGNSYVGWFGHLAPDPSHCHGEDNLWRAEHVRALGTELRGALDEAIEACDVYLRKACFRTPEPERMVSSS